MSEKEKPADNPCDDFVSSIGEHISYFMGLRGMPENDCAALSSFVMESIRQQYQGERVRILKQADVENHRARLRDAVRSERDSGASVSAIARRHKISRATAYRYLK